MKQLRVMALRLCLLTPVPLISYCQPKEIVMENNAITPVPNDKEVIRELYEQVINGRQFDLISNFVSQEYSNSSGAKGVKGFLVGVETVLQALPDAHWQIEDLIAEKDRVVIRWTLEGTHTGIFQSVKPTGKKIANEGMAIYDLKDGKIVSHRVLNDRLGFQQSLGVLPRDFSALQRKANSSNPAIFIDKFTVPPAAENEFLKRMQINRDLIKTLPGFIDDNVYFHRAPDGSLVCITVAFWEDKAAINNAREMVQSEYRRTGFDLKEMMDRLKIKMERGIFENLNSTGAIAD